MSPAQRFGYLSNRVQPPGTVTCDKTGKFIVFMLMGTGKITVHLNGGTHEFAAPDTHFALFAVNEDSFPMTIDAPGIKPGQRFLLDEWSGTSVTDPDTLPMMVGVSYRGETIIVSAPRFTLSDDISGQGFIITTEIN